VIANRSQRESADSLSSPKVTATDPSRWAVVIPSFNHADDAIACLESLWQAHPRPGFVVLVDDASTDDAVERIARWASEQSIPQRVVRTTDLMSTKDGSYWLTLARSDRNEGFVRTSNAGLRYVRDCTEAPYALLFNNDAAVSPSYFAELAKALARVPETGLLTGLIYEWDRSTVWYCGASFNPIRALATHNTDLPYTDAPTETGYVCGCSMLISRAVLEKVGLLAECFQPAYVEDVDYSLRVRAAGFPVMIARSAVCYHRVGSSLGRMEQLPRTVFSVTRNRAFTLRRNYKGWRRAAGITYLAVTKPGRALLELAKGRPRTGWAVLSGMLVGVFSPAASRD
jgi:GT2 family glycosyltransferase